MRDPAPPYANEGPHALWHVSENPSIGRFEPNGSPVGFYDARYAVPAESTRGKTKVTVRFQASQGGRIAPVFGIRTIRSTGA